MSYQDAIKDCIDIIYALKVKEVDLEKEYKDFINSDNGRSMFETAKYFFELGLNASNPLTWENVRDIYDLACNLRFSHKKTKRVF